MKKLLLLLLLSTSIFAQTTGQEQEFDYGIKNNASLPDYSASKVVVENADKVYSYQLLSQFMLEKGYMSTGLLQSGELSVNADPTKFDISASVCVFTDYTDANEPVSIIKNFTSIIGTTPTNLLTNPITYVALDIDGNVVQSSSLFSREQSRDLVMLGFVVHRNLTTIQTVLNLCEPSSDVKGQVFDFFNALGNFNIDGNVYAPNGANLNLDKTAGVLFYAGGNFHTNFKDPNRLALGQLTALTFQYRTQLGVDQTATTSINPNIYDIAGTVTAVPSNKYTIQTVYITPQNQTKIVLGQSLYNSLTEAENAIATRSFVIDASTKAQLVPRAYIVIKEGVTSLQDATHCKIKEAGKFAGTSSSGASVTLESVLSALGYTPENVANKSNSYTASSTTTYPNTKALVDGLALKVDLSETVPVSIIVPQGVDDDFTARALTLWNVGSIDTNDSNLKGTTLEVIAPDYGTGITVDAPNATGIYSASTNGTSISGISENGTGIYGGSTNGNGIFGYSDTSIPAIFNLPTGNTSNITEFQKQGVAEASISHDGKLTAKGGIITDTASAVGGASAGSALTVNQTFNTTGQPTAIKLDVTDTASNSLSKLIDLRVGGSSKFTVFKSGYTSFTGGWDLGAMNAASNYLTTNGTTSITSGNLDVFSVKAGSFAPTSGTGTYTGYLFSNTINQTGGANGITRGVYVNPTLPSAFDFRAIEFSNNTGKGLWQTGTAQNSLNNLTLSTTPTTSAGAYRFLTYNETSDAVESIASSALSTFATDITVNGVTVGRGAGNISTNTVLGNGASTSNTTGYDNVFVGNGAGTANTIGYGNTFVGRLAGTGTIDGGGCSIFGNNAGVISSTADEVSIFGSYAGYNNTTGNFNNFFGGSSGYYNTTGIENSFFGHVSGFKNTGSYNTIIGNKGGYNATTGSNNFFGGYRAGYHIANGISNATIINNSVFIGAETKPNAVSETNQIVIGYNAIGNGSNTATLGNDSVVSTYLKGKVITNDVVRLKNYTVATLPAGTQGDTAFVTDATAPTYLGTLTGGGSVVCPVFYNGTAWVSH